MAKPKFPYTAADDRALEKGETVARARYYHDLSSTAQEILKDLKNDESEVDESDLDDRIHEEADSAVIYTKNALDILVESDNWTAIDDVGEIPDDASQAVTAMAYWAYRQDLREAVDSEAGDMGIEMNPSRRAPRRKGTTKKSGKRRTKKKATSRKRPKKASKGRARKRN